MNAWVTVAGIVLALGVAVLLVHLTLTWMAGRGWIWYRSEDRPRPTSLGLIEEIYQPSIEHVTDEHASEQTRADQAESGAPDPGEGASAP